jgi:hypothetical protein
MTFPYFIAPLQHFDPSEPGERGRSYYYRNYRSFMSAKLYKSLQDSVGPGVRGLWLTEAELIQSLTLSNYYNWGWCAWGEIDPNAPHNQHNVQTHMKIMFKTPEQAMIARLSI